MGTYGDLSGPMGTYGDLWGPVGTYGLVGWLVAAAMSRR